jgi:hypothetical protein
VYILELRGNDVWTERIPSARIGSFARNEIFEGKGDGGGKLSSEMPSVDRVLVLTVNFHC